MQSLKEFKKAVASCLFWVGEDEGYEEATPICVADQDKLRSLLEDIISDVNLKRYVTLRQSGEPQK